MKAEELQFLRELQEELNTQDTVYQADPRFWVIMDYRWELAPEGCEEVYRVHDNEGNEWSLASFLDHVTDLGDYDELLDGMNTTEEYNFAEYFVTEVDDNYTLYGARLESFIVPDTMFLTLREAKEHIRSNYYHYTGRVHPYAMTAYRSPQVERLIDILQHADFSCEGESKPNEEIRSNNGTD